jgi:hypothetical protein
VFIDVLGRDTETFYKEFVAWCEKQVSTWGYDEESSKKYEELVKKGEGLMKARKDREALEVWKEIVKLRPVDELPHRRLAGLYLSKEVNDVPKAIEHLTRLHKVSLNRNMYAKAIARLHLRNNDAKAAEKMAIEAIYVDPYDTAAHELLLDCHKKAGNQEGVEREERLIPIVREWNKQHQKSTLLEGAPEP